MSMHELAELPDGSVGHGGSIYDNDPAGDDGKEMTLVSLEDLEIAQRKRQRALFRRTVAFAILSVISFTERYQDFASRYLSEQVSVSGGACVELIIRALSVCYPPGPGPGPGPTGQ